MSAHEPQDEVPVEQPPPTGERPVRRRIVVTAVLVVACLVVVGVVVVDRGDTTPATAAQPTAGPTVEVVSTDLVDAIRLDGTVGHGTAEPLRGTGEGTVTALPAAGTRVEAGDELFRVDDEPVVLLVGDTPMFRTLGADDDEQASGQQHGNDVRVLAENLAALGYLGTTARPAPSASSDASAVPDEGRSWVYTRELADAVERWQADLGLEPTGVLDPARVVVRLGPVVVESVTAQVGDPVDGDLLKVTDDARYVQAPVTQGQAAAFTKGAEVTLTTPDGVESAGTVVTVTTDEDAVGGAGTVVTVAADDAAALDDVTDVRVTLTLDAHPGVLAVPVAALLALAGGGYGLELADRTIVPVTIGMFADGLVEVSGDGLAAGTRVVSP